MQYRWELHETEAEEKLEKETLFLFVLKLIESLITAVEEFVFRIM